MRPRENIFQYGPPMQPVNICTTTFSSLFFNILLQFHKDIFTRHIPVADKGRSYIETKVQPCLVCCKKTTYFLICACTALLQVQDLVLTLALDRNSRCLFLLENSIKHIIDGFSDFALGVRGRSSQDIWRLLVVYLVQNPCFQSPPPYDCIMPVIFRCEKSHIIQVIAATVIVCYALISIN